MIFLSPFSISSEPISPEHTCWMLLVIFLKDHFISSQPVLLSEVPNFAPFQALFQAHFDSRQQEPLPPLAPTINRHFDRNYIITVINRSLLFLRAPLPWSSGEDDWQSTCGTHTHTLPAAQGGAVLTRHLGGESVALTWAQHFRKMGHHHQHRRLGPSSWQKCVGNKYEKKGRGNSSVRVMLLCTYRHTLGEKGWLETFHERVSDERIWGKYWKIWEKTDASRKARGKKAPSCSLHEVLRKF